MNILYCDAFERLLLDLDDPKPFQGSLVGFLGESMHLKGYITFKTAFGAEENAIHIKVSYIFIEESFSYNMIIGRLIFK